VKQLILVLPIFLFLGARDTPAAETDDSCVDCHRNRDFLVTDKKLYDYYQEWGLSVHRQEEVSCSDCHGGDPGASDKKKAHAGDVGGGIQTSAVNFKNIPETCGQCHEDFLEAYRGSSHFEHLVTKKQEEQGPSCVTCHGSVNESVLNVTTVQQACARCHNEILNKFLSIHRFYRYIAVRGEPEKTQEFFKKADSEIYALSVGWHSFDLEDVRERTGTVLRLMKEKRNQVRTRSRRGRER
jgi:hypothetical protein